MCVCCSHVLRRGLQSEFAERVLGITFSLGSIICGSNTVSFLFPSRYAALCGGRHVFDAKTEEQATCLKMSRRAYANVWLPLLGGRFSQGLTALRSHPYFCQLTDAYQSLVMTTGDIRSHGQGSIVARTGNFYHIVVSGCCALVASPGELQQQQHGQQQQQKKQQQPERNIQGARTAGTAGTAGKAGKAGKDRMGGGGEGGSRRSPGKRNTGSKAGGGPGDRKHGSPPSKRERGTDGGGSPPFRNTGGTWSSPSWCTSKENEKREQMRQGRAMYECGRNEAIRCFN